MKVDNLYISNVGKGVEATLVAVKDNNDQVYVSIQNNKKLRKNPKVKLISNSYEFSKFLKKINKELEDHSTPVLYTCLLYTSPSPRDRTRSRMPSSA